VNFYKRYMGDYGRKTAHLSLIEHGAYTLLLDALYSTEKGLPAGYADLFRICRAMSKTEQTAVASVADQFFPVGEDGLRHNSRAAEELEDAAPAIQAARENGRKGGRPKTQKEPSGFPEETQREPRSKASQSHSQNSPSLRSGERATQLPKDWELPDDYRAFCKAERPELDPDKVAAKFADYWRGKGGREGRKTDWLATWRNWVRDERSPAKGAFQPPSGRHTDSAEETQALLARQLQVEKRGVPDFMKDTVAQLTGRKAA
jgi:uncharacterized protein YdaU (DUF1376 family)